MSEPGSDEPDDEQRVPGRHRRWSLRPITPALVGLALLTLMATAALAVTGMSMVGGPASRPTVPFLAHGNSDPVVVPDQKPTPPRVGRDPAVPAARPGPTAGKAAHGSATPAPSGPAGPYAPFGPPEAWRSDAPSGWRCTLTPTGPRCVPASPSGSAKPEKRSRPRWPAPAPGVWPCPYPRP